MKAYICIVSIVFLLSAVSAMAYDEPDLTFYFPFESFDGNTALDQSGKGHNGTINGDIKIVDGGKIGKAAEFATGSFIDLDGPNIPPEHIPVEGMSLIAWAKCKNTGGHHAIFNARAADSTWLIHPELRDNMQFRWLLRSAGGNTIFDIKAGKWDADQWVHFAGVYDGKTGTLYVNGKEVSQGPGGAPIAADWGSGARIGYNIDNARPFTGLMDELSLWKRALTLDEIKVLMDEGMKALLSVSPEGNLTTTWGSIRTF